jgi:hypothetical protein
MENTLDSGLVSLSQSPSVVLKRFRGERPELELELEEPLVTVVELGCRRGSELSLKEYIRFLVSRSNHWLAMMPE